MTKWLGEGTGNVKSLQKLITKYVHKANTVIQPISLDITTGVFTTASPHNLSVNQSLLLNWPGKLDLSVMPKEFFSDINQIQVNTVPSPTTFTIKKSTTAYTSYASSTTFDLTKWFFETDPGAITLTGFSVKGLHATITGGSTKGDCQFWLNPFTSGMSWVGDIFVNEGYGIYTSSNAYHSTFKYLDLDLTYQIDDNNVHHARVDLRQYGVNTTPAWASGTPGVKWGVRQVEPTYNVLNEIIFRNSLTNGSTITLYDIGGLS